MKRDAIRIIEETKGTINERYTLRLSDILDIKKYDYESVINTGILKDYDIINKLVKFNFPVSIFRNENPSLLPMRKNLEYIIQEYFINKNINEFRSKLKLEMIYTNYEENAIVFMLVYNILKTVIEEDDTHLIDLLDKCLESDS